MTDPATEILKAEEDTEAKLTVLFHTTIAEVAKGALERSRDSAKYVQTAAAAINALYTGALALVFSVTDNPLPLRGLYATVFLGLAVALATAYLAFLTQPEAPPPWSTGATRADNQVNRTGWLTQYVGVTVLHRKHAIRSSVVALGLGVLFIPAPFLTLSRPAALPAAPAAPAVPATIAPQVATEATDLFRAQVAEFKEVSTARAAALKARRDQKDRDWMLDAGFGALALVGAVVVGLGPKVVARKDPPPRGGIVAPAGVR